VILPPAKKIYLASAAFSLLIIGLLFFPVWPLLKQIKATSLGLAQKKQDIDSFFTNWQNLESSRQEYQEIQNQLKEHSSFLPADSAIDFIMILENFAQMTENRQVISAVKKITPTDSATDASAFKNPSFQITLWGSFPNLIKFLIYLENAPYFTKVDSLQINRLTERDLTSPEKETAGLKIGDVKSLINLTVYQKQ